MRKLYDLEAYLPDYDYTVRFVSLTGKISNLAVVKSDIK